MHRSSTEKLNIPGSSVEELGTVKHRNKTSHDWGWEGGFNRPLSSQTEYD